MDARGSAAAPGRSTVWKRVGIGCLAVLGIGAIAAFVIVAIVVKQRYPWILEAGRAGQEMIRRSQGSPVTAELNRTLCLEAMVLSTEDLTRIQDLIGQKDTRVGAVRWMVSCRVRDAAHAPACDRVASAFRDLQPDPGKFVVVVTAGFFRGASRPVCSAAYDGSGSPLRRSTGPSPAPGGKGGD